MTPTFRQYLESVRKPDASAHDILSCGAGVAEADSWAEAMTALKRVGRFKDMRWAVRFLWHDYIRNRWRSD